jgi:rubrerythrin
MTGGINAWNGVVAEGAYDEGMEYFSRVSHPEELISLSWALEEGNRVFYEGVSRNAPSEEFAALFRSLGFAEERHKDSLRALYARVAGTAGEPVPPAGVGMGIYLEGGSTVAESLAWATGKAAQEILEFAVAMEANSLDRYSKMARAVTDEVSTQLFRTLGREENDHLERMASLLERLRRPP